ncbi:MAG: hypothetical protein HXY29_14825, partial [Rhodocyclaceae bacterium]|nr:hypothetical protein [Rhodocyclaceae bacterium]
MSALDRLHVMLPSLGLMETDALVESHLERASKEQQAYADFLAELRLRFGDFLGKLALEGPRFGYPLSL